MNGWNSAVFGIEMKSEFQEIRVGKIPEFDPEPEILIIHIDHGIEDVEILRTDQGQIPGDINIVGDQPDLANRIILRKFKIKMIFTIILRKMLIGIK
jgi:hypothetical protein